MDAASSSEMPGMPLTLSPSSSPSSPLHFGRPGFHTLQLHRCNHPLQVCDCQWHDQDHWTNSRECVCSDREISEDQHVLWLRRFHHRLHINPQVLQVFKRQTNWGSKDHHSSAGCSASKRRSNRLQPQSNFASSDSQHLLLSLSSSLDPSAASSTSSSDRT